MSKITFRADDALVERLDGLDASKSEVMREALREFLDRHTSSGNEREVRTAERSEAYGDVGGSPELTVNINLDGGDEPTATVDAESAPATGEEPAGTTSGEEAAGTTGDEDERTCKQCGEAMDPGHAFCPNCGEEHRRRPRCECGGEIRADWAFCPRCGRRSAAADVFDRP